MTETVRIVVEEPSQTAEARRLARKCAQSNGFDEKRTEQVAIAVTEAATNILKHAGRGEILINCVPPAPDDVQGGLEILALDRGAGISNLQRCMEDGYSTAGSPGQGLGAIRRLSSAFDLYSAAGKGTALVARWPSNKDEHGLHDSWFMVGAVNASKPGQTVCGDAWGCVQKADHTTLVVADGLGHGLEASLASRDAVRVLNEHPDLEPKPLLELIHLVLRSSRGAAVAVARIEPHRGKLIFAGAGNISAQIYSGSRAVQHLVSVNGTAGHQMQQAREFSYVWPESGILVMHSDGLTSATGLEAYPGVALRDASLMAGLLYRDYSRGHDDSTVVVIKAAGHAEGAMRQ